MTRHLSTPAFAAVVLTLVTGAARADSLATSDDSTLSFATPSGNFGGSVDLVVAAGNKVTDALLRFDLTPLPGGVALSKATLRLWVEDVNAPGTVTVRRVTGAWSEETVRGAAPPAIDAMTLGTITLGASSVRGWVAVDLTAQASAWLAGAQANHGVVLVPDATVKVVFSAKEAVHGPVLEAVPVGPSGPAGAPGEAWVGMSLAPDPQGSCPDGGSMFTMSGQPSLFACNGAPGAAGTTGADGADGAPGADGPTGAQGPAGPAGPAGSTGPQGLTGPAGESGAVVLDSEDRAVGTPVGPGMVGIMIAGRAVALHASHDGLHGGVDGFIVYTGVSACGPGGLDQVCSCDPDYPAIGQFRINGQPSYFGSLSAAGGMLENVALLGLEKAVWAENTTTGGVRQLATCDFAGRCTFYTPTEQSPGTPGAPGTVGCVRATGPNYATLEGFFAVPLGVNLADEFTPPFHLKLPTLP